MKKIIELIKKKDIDIFALITFFVTVMAFYRTLNPYDELWLFSYTYKMHLGYKLYNDLNVIVTPLFFWIGNLLFNIFKPNFLTFTFYGISIYVTILMLVYKLFKMLKVKRRRAIIYTIIIFFLIKDFITGGGYYNILVYIPIIITIMLLIRGWKNKYLLGAMCFITFIIKQNIGIYFTIGVFLYELISKANFKQKIKNITKIIFSFIVLLTGFLFILYKQNILYNFINYCFLGIGEFGTSNFYLPIENLIKMIIFISMIALNIFILNNKKIKIDNKIRNNACIMLCIGAPLLLIAYPIFNSAHIIKSSIIIVIEFIYILDATFITELPINRKIEKRIYIGAIIAIMILMLIYIGILIYIDIGNNSNFDKNSPYYGILCGETIYKEINNICNYIKQENVKGIEVKVLSHKANLYMSPLKKHNGDLDLPILGNLGKEGETGLINKIKSLKNTKILIQTNEEDIFWQESKNVRKYIQDNYTKEGTIEDFDIYYID